MTENANETAGVVRGPRQIQAEIDKLRAEAIGKRAWGLKFLAVSAFLWVLWFVSYQFLYYTDWKLMLVAIISTAVGLFELADFQKTERDEKIAKLEQELARLKSV